MLSPTYQEQCLLFAKSLPEEFTNLLWKPFLSDLPRLEYIFFSLLFNLVFPFRQITQVIEFLPPMWSCYPVSMTWRSLSSIFPHMPKNKETHLEGKSGHRGTDLEFLVWALMHRSLETQTMPCGHSSVQFTADFSHMNGAEVISLGAWTPGKNTNSSGATYQSTCREGRMGNPEQTRSDECFTVSYIFPGWERFHLLCYKVWLNTSGVLFT